MTKEVTVMEQEKTILCYGDSNTWGYVPGGNGARHPRDVRWPGRLQKLLGSRYYVIEEGLNSRTIVWDDPVKGDKSGLEYITPCLQSHKPLDLVIIMLGSNDTKERFNLDGYDIARSMTRLLDAVIFSRAGIGGNAPKVLLISPPLIREDVTPEVIVREMGPKAPARARELARYYRIVAKDYGIAFLDAAKVTKASAVDTIHMDEEGHRLLADAVAVEVRRLLSEDGAESGQDASSSAMCGALKQDRTKNSLGEE